jgi:thiaminase (transcriptional activator TenA)
VQELANPSRREGYTADLWRSIKSIYAEILAHPFLTGLTDGTLAEERFRFYVLQDAFSIRKKSALLGKAPVISALRSRWITTESLSIL